MINAEFTAPLIKTLEKGGWTYVVWPESAKVLETRKAVKVAGTVDGHPFETTFMPMGDGTHLLPFKAAILKAIKKGPGDTVAVHIERRA